MNDETMQFPDEEAHLSEIETILSGEYQKAADAVNNAELVKRIADLYKEKKIEGISELRDELTLRTYSGAAIGACRRNRRWMTLTASAIGP